ncbi:MAG: hypothetical protein AAFV88_17690 [Planctomycetota bacterium]
MSTVMQRLLWKDYRLLRGLFFAVPFFVVLFTVLIEFAGQAAGFSRAEITGLYATQWFLLPGLYAFGGPALLVGGEHDGGSLEWLKMMPARWWQIASSKLAVCSAGVLLAWVPTSGLLWLSAKAASQRESFPGEWWLAGLFSLALVLGLMLISFTMVYAIRSAVAALLITMVLATLTVGLWSLSLEFLFDERRVVPTDPTVVWQSAGLSAVFFTTWLGLMTLAAWRRLTVGKSSFRKGAPIKTQLNGFRPPSVRRIAPSWQPPSQVRALLWSHLYPIRWQLILVLLLAMLSLILGTYEGEWVIVMMPILAFVLGSMTFFSDSSRKRALFFFDRGVSPSLVWSTRVIPIAAFLALLIGLHAWLVPLDRFSPISTREHWISGTIIHSCLWFSFFAVGQFVAQSTTRATLSFFAGPAVYYLITLVSLFWYYHFPSAVPLVLLSSLILLLATYRLSGSWLTQQPKSKRYFVPWLRWLAVAVFIPLPIILGSRWATMPPEQTQWRNDMLTTTLPTQKNADRLSMDPKVKPRLTMRSLGGLDERIQLELDDVEAMGNHVSAADLISLFLPAESFYTSTAQFPSTLDARIFHYFSDDRTLTDQQVMALRILEKWSKETRTQLTHGQAGFSVLVEVAEPIDWLRASILKNAAKFPEKDISTLIAGLPSRQQVMDSRRAVLYRERRAYENGKGLFVGWVIEPPQAWWLGVERTRADRAVDQLAKLLMEIWLGKTDYSDSVVTELRKQAYAKEGWSGRGGLREHLLLMRESDDRLDQLRSSQASP